VISQGGDFYGRPVNLASRITGVARPGTVLAAEAAIEAAGDAFSYSFAGERRLKGIKGGVKLYRVRREPKAGNGDGRRGRKGLVPDKSFVVVAVIAFLAPVTRELIRSCSCRRS